MCRACVDDEGLARLCKGLSLEDLRRIYLFEDMDDRSLLRLKEETELVSLADRDWLFLEGDPAPRFFHLVEGRLALLRSSVEGEEIVMAILEAGETCAEGLTFLENPRHSLSARAVGRCRLLAFDSATLRQELGQSVALCWKLMDTLHRRESRLMDQVQCLAHRDATQRFVAYLLEQALPAPAGDPGMGAKRVGTKIPKILLASRLAIRPETLSRIIARLEAEGLLEEDRRGWTLPDPGALERQVGCACCRIGSWGCPGPTKRIVEPVPRPEGPGLSLVRARTP